MTSKLHRIVGLVSVGALVVVISDCASKDASSIFPATGSGAGGSSSATSATGSTGGSSSTGGTNVTSGGGLTIVPPGGTGGARNADAAVGPCVNLQCQQTTCVLGACQQKACPNGAKTTVSGIVYDPAGKVPLYNVIVYVPNADVPPIPAGVTCDRCGSTAINPVTSAITDTKGQFVLPDVPVGTNIPIVLQVGKWRRQFKVPTVTACADTPLTDKEVTRLPKNQSEGDIPLIAITTGAADSMECLPIRMGIDPAEFTTDTGTGRIHLYSGHDNNRQRSTKAFDPTHNAGATFTGSTVLWNDLNNLKKYDIVILSCEGATNDVDKPAAALQNMYDYESVGGRVFASHWHRVWFSPNAPAPVPQIGTWNDEPDPPMTVTAAVNTTFPKGQAMSDWLVNVGASTTAGQLTIQQARDNVSAVNPTMATSWITLQNSNARMTPDTVEFLSYNAPLNVPDDMVCGRAVFNDLHVSAGATGDRPGTVFPMSCQPGDLSDQEKALEFMLFDLSSCVRNDNVPPAPPPIPR